MAFVGVAVGVGTAVGLGTGTAALIGGGALIGAGIGGLYSGITGDGNILNSMLTGGLLGGSAAGLAGAFGAGAGAGASGTGLTSSAAAAAPSTAAIPTANVLTPTAAQAAGYGTMSAAPAASTFGTLSAAPAASTFGTLAAPTSTATQLATSLGGKAATSALTGKQMLGYGLAGTTAMQLLGGGKGAQAPASATYPGDIRPYEYSARPVSDTGESAYPTTQYDMAGNPILDTQERTYFDQGYQPLQVYKAGTANPNPVMAAQGGLMSAYPMEKYGNTIPNTEVYGIGMAEGGVIGTRPPYQPRIAPPSTFDERGGMRFNQREYELANPNTRNDMDYVGIGGLGTQPRSLPSIPNQPTGQSMFPGAAAMQSGFGQGAQGYPSFAMGSGGFGSSGGSGGAFPLQGQYGIVKMAEGGEVEMDEKRRKAIMKNMKGASTEQLENMLGSMNQQEFLMKNMPNYAQAMRPSISGMVEGAQYGDRMAQSYGAQPRDINVMPTNIDPQSGMYGGIASIGRQVDPNTRVNAMANIQRTPYDRNAMDAVRRLGVGVDRQLGKDTNLSAFYEQDPKGRDKMGGVRLSQRFAKGGMSDLGGYSDGGRMLKGPGDGMSDHIPGVIGGRQPARLADGEFVVPADVVSHLGNGSTDAGAKRLYAMMDTVRKARTGTKKQGKQIKAEKYLPA